MSVIRKVDKPSYFILLFRCSLLLPSLIRKWRQIRSMPYLSFIHLDDRVVVNVGDTESVRLEQEAHKIMSEFDQAGMASSSWFILGQWVNSSLVSSNIESHLFVIGDPYSIRDLAEKALTKLDGPSLLIFTSTHFATVNVTGIVAIAVTVARYYPRLFLSSESFSNYNSLAALNASPHKVQLASLHHGYSFSSLSIVSFPTNHICFLFKIQTH